MRKAIHAKRVLHNMQKDYKHGRNRHAADHHRPGREGGNDYGQDVSLRILPIIYAQ